MRYFKAKKYQTQTLNSIEDYFDACHRYENPALAFYALTNIAYNTLAGFAPDMPYFCLRIPTGGGKTWLAAESVAIINRALLRSEHSVILWLVPSNSIKEQTLKGLKDLEHPLHAALCKAGAISVLSLDEAKSVTRATLDTSTTIIVATRQAFQVGNEENRKVYESNGALMAHFDGITLEQRQQLLSDGETVPYSLANVLRLRRPFVIVDEAHNSRTELGFDTLAKFCPSGIMELTATPDLEKKPSNVLCSIYAAELKDQQMIKLPILLTTEIDWQNCLSYAVTKRNDLQVLADKEYQQGGVYLRPIVLIQAEAKRTGTITLDVETVKQELLNNHNIPAEEIVIATGEDKGLSKINADYALGIQDKNCPVKFVITQKALAEGWDCPFAYVLVSMANVHSSTAVEQLLGRILRQPDASHRHTPELNQSYAFVVSDNFNQTALALQDSLVKGAGFNRQEVSEFVKKTQPIQPDLEAQFTTRKIPPVTVTLEETPQLDNLPIAVKDKVTWQADTKTLTVHTALTTQETESLKTVVNQASSKDIIANVAEHSRVVAIEFFQTPAERGLKLCVPQLAIYVQGELQLFEDPKMLDYPWHLERCSAVPLDNDINRLTVALQHKTGILDIDEKSGKVIRGFIQDLQRALDLVYQPEHWNEVKLAAWLCRNMLKQDDIIPASKLIFVKDWLQALLKHFNLVEINQQKFLIIKLLAEQISELRQQAINSAYQNTLFDNRKAVVNDDYVYEFPAFYTPRKYYDANKYGYYDFRNHFHGKIGDFDSKEEYECACHLDQLAEQKRIKYWLRNLISGTSAFFLQKADGKFYPDFICQLLDDSILVVEYKGFDRWDSAKDDRDIGELWASLSKGKCRFIMVTKKQFHEIDTVIKV